jgi:hypothetical protein
MRPQELGIEFFKRPMWGRASARYFVKRQARAWGVVQAGFLFSKRLRHPD